MECYTSVPPRLIVQHSTLPKVAKVQPWLQNPKKHFFPKAFITHFTDMKF